MEPLNAFKEWQGGRVIESRDSSKPGLSLHPSSMTMDKSLKLAKPLFSHLKIGDNKSIYVMKTE